MAEVSARTVAVVRTAFFTLALVGAGLAAVLCLAHTDPSRQSDLNIGLVVLAAMAAVIVAALVSGLRHFFPAEIVITADEMVEAVAEFVVRVPNFLFMVLQYALVCIVFAVCLAAPFAAIWCCVTMITTGRRDPHVWVAPATLIAVAALAVTIAVRRGTIRLTGRPSPEKPPGGAGGLIAVSVGLMAVIWAGVEALLFLWENPSALILPR